MTQTSYPEWNRRRTATSIGISLLLHAFLFLFFRSHLPKAELNIGDDRRAPLVVELGRQASPSAPPPRAAPQAPAAPPTSAPPPPARPPVAKRPAPRKPAPPRVAEAPRPTLPKNPAPPASAPPASASPQAPSDMSDMVAAARARRRAAGIPAPEEGTAPAPQADDAARANVARSVAQARGDAGAGAGGIFQITHLGVREAEFLFRGWDRTRRAGTRQRVQVDAGPNGNVEDAIVRKMIEIIRQHESGDFSWESRRLGRVVMLSARAQDNAGLEDFLKKEFFDSLR
jgi:hypothetical protein